MSKKILIPLDDPRTAETILPMVCTLSTEAVHEFALLHVVHWDYPPANPTLLETIREKKQAVLRDRQTYLAGVAAQLAMLGCKVSIEICEGPVVPAIIHTAQHLGVDFIAVSTYSSSAQRHGTSNSIANRMLQEAKTPVMVIVHPEQNVFHIEPVMLYWAVLAGQTLDA